MARINVKDLPENQIVSEREAARVLGGLKGDFANYYYYDIYAIKRLRYSGVILQQGRVLKDDDWND